MGNMINIGGRIHNPEVGNVVAGANEIYDDTKQKKQNVINAETDASLLNLSQNKQDNLTFDNAPTENSTNPVTSGGVYAADAALQQAIEAILLLIPSAASALNQLADKAFVNSSIATNTATFRGTYNSVSDLHLAVDATHAQIEAALDSTIATADNNDYCYVQIPVSATSFDIEKTERYKFNGTGWKFEYQLNTSGFTAAQWNAINSGITAALVGDLNFIKSVVPSEATTLNQLADKAYVVAQIIASIPAFKGQFETLADLQAVASPKAGDLGIVRTKDSDGYDVFVFYQYLNSQWNVFYTLSHHLLKKPASTGTTGDYPYNGMGRVVIPKNMVNIAEQGEPENIVNLLTQEAFEDGEDNPLTDTVFVIQYDFVLGEDIDVPANCVLEFDGGSITASGNNDTITGNNTQIKAADVAIFTGVVIAGTWICPRIVSEWFSDVTQSNRLKQVFNLANNNVSNTILINQGNYTVDALQDNTYEPVPCLSVPSNTIVILEGTINLVPNNFTHYAIFGIRTVENVVIKGSGSIIGDADDHTFIEGSTSEWGMGIAIARAAKNIIVEGITVSKCIGDGINLSNVSSLAAGINKDIIIRNVEISYCGRQGISVVNGNNILIENFYIHHVERTDMKAAIDIEPTVGEVKNVLIRNGKADNCKRLIIVPCNSDSIIENIKVDNCICDSCYELAFAVGASSSKIASIDINNTRATNIKRGVYASDYSNISVRNSYINVTKDAQDGNTGYCLISGSNTSYIFVDNSELISSDKIMFYYYHIRISNSILSAATMHGAIGVGSEYNLKLYNNKIDIANTMTNIRECIGNVFTKTSEIWFVGSRMNVQDNTFSGHVVLSNVTYANIEHNIFKTINLLDIDRSNISNNVLNGTASDFIMTVNANSTYNKICNNFFASGVTNMRCIYMYNTTQTYNDVRDNYADFTGIEGAKYLISGASGYATLKWGSTANRPATDMVLDGSTYFDTTENKLKCKNGSAWVDATGTPV